MAEQEFIEFVKRKAAQDQTEAGQAIDWDKRKTDWLNELDALYTKMKRYLKPFDEIQIECSSIQICEDYLGTYDVDKLTFKIGPDKIIAKPIGTLLIGAWGRVDLSGPRKTLKIVLLEEPEVVITTSVRYSEGTEESSRPVTRDEVDEGGWYIETPPPESVVVAFNKDSFREAIMEVSGG